MKLKYNIEFGLKDFVSKKNNGLLHFDYLNSYSGIIRYVLESDNKIKDIKIEGVMEL